MNVVAVLEIALAVLVVLTGVTQLVVPLWRGPPVFPLFRRERKLEAELADASEEVVEADLERQIAEKRRLAERTRRPPGPHSL